MQVNGIVIAGGKSSRMGSNKAFLKFQGQRLIDKAIQTIEPLCDNILISSNVEIPLVKYPIVKDVFDAIGPLGGLQACLAQSNAELNLIIPCDVPLLSIHIYEQLLASIDNYDAIIPMHDKEKVEPLIAIYRKSTLPFIEKQIASKDYKMMHLLQQIKITYLPFEDSSFFKNMNTPKDMV